MTRESFLFEPQEIVVPATPTGLQVIRRSGPNVNIRWITPVFAGPKQGIQSYIIYHSTDDITYVEIGHTYWPVRSFTHERLTEATHYYKVSALSVNAIESALTAAVSIVIGKLQPYTNTIALVAGVPQTINLITEIGREMQEGTIVGLGPGNVLVELSADGATYTNVITVRPEDYIDLSDVRKNLEIQKIRLDTNVTGTSVTVSVI